MSEANGTERVQLFLECYHRMFSQVFNNVTCDSDNSYLIKLLRWLFEKLSQHKTKLSETIVYITVNRPHAR